eukprot:4633486-Amphidinium_carterae.1
MQFKPSQSTSALSEESARGYTCSLSFVKQTGSGVHTSDHLLLPARNFTVNFTIRLTKPPVPDSMLHVYVLSSCSSIELRPPTVNPCTCRLVANQAQLQTSLRECHT